MQVLRYNREEFRPREDTVTTMSYQALYRVWRPQSFEDVVGQSHITRTLQNALVEDKFSHAYLFSGPRGTGKTSAAKIFAKAINCEQAPVREPCGECDRCKGIQSGAIPDVMEIDAASNNGVEQIRDIRDKVKYAPTSVPYKVYIIDEVHMLSMGAFNALLKTLEEPPQHVIFILATTEPHKIPLTIISRCQRFDFKRITQKALIGRMKDIMEKEAISVTDDAYHQIALAAEGGMRDALSLLDQAISYSEDEVILDDVLAITGSVSQARLSALVTALAEKEVSTGLQLVDAFIQEGKDPGRMVHDLIYFLRDILLYKSSTQLVDQMERARVDTSFEGLVDQLDAHWIQAAIGEFNHCQQEMKWTTSPKVFIEISVLKLTETKQTQIAVSDEQVLQLTEKLGKLEKELRLLKEQGIKATEQAPQQTKRKRPVTSKNSYKVPFERIRMVLEKADKDSLKAIHQQWPNFMQTIKQKSAPAHATIVDAKPAAASSDTLVLAFKFEIHCSLALDHQQLIEDALLELLGHKVTFLPIPETEWLPLRQTFIDEQKQRSKDDGTSEETEDEGDPVVEEARKLVGDALLEIHEE